MCLGSIDIWNTLSHFTTSCQASWASLPFARGAWWLFGIEYGVISGGWGSGLYLITIRILPALRLDSSSPLNSGQPLLSSIFWQTKPKFLQFWSSWTLKISFPPGIQRKVRYLPDYTLIHAKASFMDLTKWPQSVCFRPHQRIGLANRLKFLRRRDASRLSPSLINPR